MRFLYLIILITQIGVAQSSVQGTWECKQPNEVLIFNENEAIWSNITDSSIWQKGYNISYIRYEKKEQSDTLIFQPYKVWTVSTNTGTTQIHSPLNTSSFKILKANKNILVCFNDNTILDFEKTDKKVAILKEPAMFEINKYYQPKKEYYFGYSIHKKPSIQLPFFK